MSLLIKSIDRDKVFYLRMSVSSWCRAVIHPILCELAVWRYSTTSLTSVLPCVNLFNPLLDYNFFLDFSKLKEFADNNFKFDESGRKLPKQVKKHSRKRRNCSLRAISPFPTVFSRDSFPRGVKRCHCVGMG